MTSFFRPTLLLLLLLPLAACDETGGLSADVDAAVQDAIIARQSGDYERAVEILEDAHDREPDNAAVRVELATTLLERDEIDLLDVDRIARFITEGAGTAAGAANTIRSGAACPYASDPTARSFEPADIDGFTGLVAEAASVDRAIELLSTIVPPEVGDLDLCMTFVGDQLVYDRDAAIDALRAQGLTEAQVRQALAVNALAHTVGAYVFVSTELVEEATWYRLSDGSIALCADDPEALRDGTEDAVNQFGEAVLSLDARASLLDGGVAPDLVALAQDAFDQIRDAIGFSCNGA